MAENIEDLVKDNKSLKEKLSVAMQRLDMYESDDLEKQGYFALKSIVSQQVNILMDFKVKEEIVKNPKDDKMYDRVKAIGEGMRAMITDLKTLKAELNISSEEEKANRPVKKRAITAESVADNVGELAGKSY